MQIGCTPPHASRNPLRCTLSDKGNLGMALSAHSGARVGGFAPIGQPQSSAVAKTLADSTGQRTIDGVQAIGEDIVG